MVFRRECTYIVVEDVWKACARGCRRKGVEVDLNSHIKWKAGEQVESTRYSTNDSVSQKDQRRYLRLCKAISRSRYEYMYLTRTGKSPRELFSLHAHALELAELKIYLYSLPLFFTAGRFCQFLGSVMDS